MIRSWPDDRKRKSVERDESWMKAPIVFPPLLMEDTSDEPLIIEAVMEGYLVRRVYVDQGASVDVMRGKTIRKIKLEVVFGNRGLFRTVMINFTVVRAPSPYNVIFGRTSLSSLSDFRKLYHYLVKVPTPKGIATLVTRSAIISECQRLEKRIQVSCFGPDDEEKTAFYMDQGMYCYMKMLFGLKNAGATYQSNDERVLITDIAETFDNLRKINMQLNLKKCSFGVEEGKFLGYMVTFEGIRAKPKKTKAIADMQSPQISKDMQSLSGKLATLKKSVLGYRCIRTELMTPDLARPSTHQLLRSIGDDSRPDVSFDKSDYLDHFFGFKDVCMDDGPSSLKKWKNKFFLIDRRAILNYLTWRHSCSCVLDDLPSDGYDRNDVQRLRVRLICLCEMREEVLVRSGLSSVWFNKECDPRVPSHTTAPAIEDAIISLPTPDEVAASLPDSCLTKELDQAEGVNKDDLANFCAKIEDSLEWDEGVSTRAVSVSTPRLGKRFDVPPSTVVVSAFEPPHARVSVPASTFGHSLSLGGTFASGHTGKFRAEVVRRQMDPLDCLACSALGCDAEYDQIPNDDFDDDFGTATRGEEIDLTLFPLAPGPYHMPYPYEGISSPLYTKEEKALDRTITPAELRRTESLLPLELSNHDKLNQKKRVIKLLRLEVTSLDDKLEKLQGDYDALVLSEELTLTDWLSIKKQALTVRDLQNELALEKSKSQGYKDAMDGLREEVAQFVGSGVKGVVRKLLSSDEFHAALARADFDKALVDFPTTPFPFLSKIVAASRGTLFDVSKILPDKFVHSATSVAVARSSANETLEQVSP
ncbi:hypothetical protein Tco_0900767 [Tanacetum coccineum]